MTDTPTSLVALGRAGTGAAAVVEGGNRPLDILLRGDQLEARRRERAAQAAAREQDSAARDFSANAKLNSKGFLPFQPYLDQIAQQKYTNMEATARDRSLDRFQKTAAYRRDATDMEGLTNLTLELETKAKQVLALGQDKRYNKKALNDGLFQTFFDPETKEIVDPRKYDASVMDQLALNPDYFDTGEVVKQWVKALPMNSTQYGEQARPGGSGFNRSVSSNLAEQNPDGTYVTDKKTGDPVLNITDATIMAANQDSFLGPVLDQKMRQRQERLDPILEKMRNNEQLTDEERTYAASEDAQKGRKDDLKDLVLSHVYLRTKEQKTFRPAPQPRVGRSGGTPKYTINGAGGGGEYVAAAETRGGTGQQGGLYSPYKQDARTRVTSTGKVEPISFANARHNTYAVQVPGQKLRFVTNNPISGPVVYNGLLMALTNPQTGNVLVPGANVPKTREGFMQWAKETQRTKGYEKFNKIDWTMEATPGKKENFLGGNYEEIYNNLVNTQEQNAAASKDKKDDPSAGLSTKSLESMSSDEKRLYHIKLLAAAQSGKSYRKRSTVELASLARDLSKKTDATYYLPYSKEKASIDSYTNGVYKPSAQETQMLADYNRQLQQGGGRAAPATAPGTGGLYQRADAPSSNRAKKGAKSNNAGLY